MSRKEVVRPGLVKALVAGQLTNRQVAAALRLSVRQVQRLKRRFEAAGVAGLRRDVIHPGPITGTSAPLGLLKTRRPQGHSPGPP